MGQEALQKATTNILLASTTPRYLLALYQREINRKRILSQYKTFPVTRNRGNLTQRPITQKSTQAYVRPALVMLEETAVQMHYEQEHLH